MEQVSDGISLWGGEQGCTVGRERALRQAVVGVTEEGLEHRASGEVIMGAVWH